jgi:hypothetical protein
LKRPVHELDPALRDRLLGLDEPVARPDWHDVLSRSGPAKPRRTAGRVALIAAVVCFGAIAVAPAMGVRLGITSFWAAPAAPKSAQTAFAARGMVLPDSMLRGLKLGQMRRIAIRAFKGDTERLFVAPRGRGGGFCYEWATEPGDPGIWVDELGGCGDPSLPLNISYDDTRISIVANRPLADHVRLTLTDGRVVHPSLRWVSDPINAGFALYQPPLGVHVLYVEAIAHNRVVATDQISQALFQVQTR